MKNFILFSLLLSIGTVVHAQRDSLAYRTLFKSVQQKYAPDKRSVYLDVQFRGDTAFVESTSKAALDALRAASNDSHYVQVVNLLPSKSLNGMEYGLANLSVCNNRAAPQNAAEMMTQMILGTPVQVLKRQGGFYLVKTPDGYLSWTDATAVSLMNPDDFNAWRKSDRVIYSADYGHAYTKAKRNSERVSDLVKGNILAVLGSEKGFFMVRFPDQRVGYILKSEAQSFQNWKAQKNPDAARVLTTAKTMIGVPYLWGGTSLKGVDCSGFTKTSYFLNGIIIPRDASQQALVGKPVDVLEGDSTSLDKCLKNLIPGDLLFFSAAKLRGTIGGRVTHTAIYMGEGTFIQSAGMVRISSLIPTAPNFDARESKTLVGARRILSEIGEAEITRVNQHEWYN